MLQSFFIFLALGVLLALGLVSSTANYAVNWAWFATLILLLALVAFWRRFDRSRVETRELALISVLAALAAAFRLPFAALVNVQPTTFLVLISGYVFGLEPGFAVGAAAALVSNFFLGQGPWTPWQMLAWGLGGAAAGLWGRYQAGFPPAAFAAAAGLWGFLYGSIMNLWHWAGFIYPLTWKTFLATYMLSLPFDAMHAVGNVVFALVFGPSFYRILARFRDKSIIYYRDGEKRDSSSGRYP